MKDQAIIELNRLKELRLKRKYKGLSFVRGEFQVNCNNSRSWVDTYIPMGCDYEPDVEEVTDYSMCDVLPISFDGKFSISSERRRLDNNNFNFLNR